MTALFKSDGVGTVTAARTGGTGTALSACAAGNLGPCTSSNTSGSVVTLTASAVAPNSFVSWSGCSSTNTTGGNHCIVNMTNDKNITVNFNTNALTVTKSGDGKGKITISPASASGNYANGTSVTLTAIAADAGGNIGFVNVPSTFMGWNGCDSTSKSADHEKNANNPNTDDLCTVVMNSDQDVTASFNTNKLTITKTGDGEGIVTGTGITCGATLSSCGKSYASGSVTLRAYTSSGYAFTDWSGCDSTSKSAGNTGTIDDLCTVTMNSDKNVAANFEEDWMLALMQKNCLLFNSR